MTKTTLTAREVDGSGNVLRLKDLRRELLGLWSAQLPTDTVIAMEACSGTHRRTRRCLE